MATGADTSATTSTAPVDSGGATDSAVDTSAPADTAPSLPSADEFGWDDWDGTEDRLPEPLRPWAQRFQGHYTRDLTAAKAEVESQRALYEAMMEGREDPRVGEYRTRYETEQQTHERIRAEHEAKTKEFEAYRAQVDAHFEKQSRAEVDAWRTTNSWIFDEGEVQNAALDLITVGFDYEELPEILRMPDEMQKTVREFYKELTESGATKGAGKHAIRLARAEFKLAEPAPAAKLVTGPASARTARTAEAAPQSLQDQTNFYIRQAMRQG